MNAARAVMQAGKIVRGLQNPPAMRRMQERQQRRNIFVHPHFHKRFRDFFRIVDMACLQFRFQCPAEFALLAGAEMVRVLPCALNHRPKQRLLLRSQLRENVLKILPQRRERVDAVRGVGAD